MIPTLRRPAPLVQAFAAFPAAFPAAFLAAFASPAVLAAANVNPHGTAFVSLYRCDAQRWLAVAYPAPFARRSEPVRLAWDGSTVLLAPVRPGSGARYVNRSADLEWRIDGRSATLHRLSDRTLLVSGCHET